MEQPPESLAGVARLFRFFAWVALVDVVMSLLMGDLVLAYQLLGFPIARGLLRYESRWRNWALVVLAVDLLAPLVYPYLALGTTGTLTTKVGPFRDPPTGVWVTYSVIVTLLALWQLRVLLRPDVRRLFSSSPPGDGGPLPTEDGLHLT